jgi:hypothetical protein
MIIKYVSKMENKKIIVGIFVLMAIQLVSATSINIDINKAYEMGDKISFNYTFLSDISQDIEYIASVDCPNAPLGLLDVITVNLEANIPLTETYVYMTSVDGSIEPQECKAVVGIISPEEKSEEKSFQIVTDPSFEMDIKICEDEFCNNQSKIFILNDNIYFNYISEVPEPIIQITLTYPDGTVKPITLPGSIKAEQVGTYELEIISSKDGYKDIEQSVQFGVIEKNAKIHEGFLPIEKDKPETEEEKSPVFVFVILGVLLLAIVLVVLFKVKNGRK